MSTKNLSRTLIEGGRTGSNKWDRRYSRAKTRADEKFYLGKVKADLENFYKYDIPKTRVVYKEFNDKLGQMYRWLHSQIGRPWKDVRSEVTTTFDTRTTAGRHIVYDHILQSVEVTPDVRYRYGLEDRTTSHYYHDYYVDDEGLLRMKIYIPRNKNHMAPQYNTAQIANWLSGRIVGKMGSKFYWFIPADKNKKCGVTDHTWRTYWGTRKYYASYCLRFLVLAEETIYKLDPLTGIRMKGEDGNPIAIGFDTVWKDSHPSAFRQGNKLSNKEVEYFNKLPEYYQTKVLELSPNYPNPPNFGL